MIHSLENEPAGSPAPAPQATADAPRFELGQVAATAGAVALFGGPEAAGPALSFLLRLHRRGDWGPVLDADDKQANEDALQDGGRILSAYLFPDGGELVKLYVITEAADHEGRRHQTTIMRADEY